MLSFWLLVKVVGCTPPYLKFLHEIAGEPLLGHVLSVAQSLVDYHGGRIRVVTGHGAAQVDPFVIDRGAEVIHQNEQLGTGHALQIAMHGLGADGQTLVLYGDVPLISQKDIEPLIAAGKSRLAVLYAVASDPTGYGRIVRNDDGNVIADC